MLNFIKNIFGSKYDRDVKAYSGQVDLINQFYKEYESLSIDDLRNKTLEFKQRIKVSLADIDSDIESLTQQANDELDFIRKEEIFNEVDKLKKERNTYLENALKDLLPEAFAVVKETARRFMKNEIIEVIASQSDRDLSVNKEYVSIQGEKAIWKNSWKAAGEEIVWNMLHYDVQLIGGMVLHEGKVAEMATGEGKTLVATLPAYLNGLSGQGVHVITVNDYLAK